MNQPETDASLLRSNKVEYFFGSDPSKCDFLLDDKKTNGISGQHLRLYLLHDDKSKDEKIILGIQNLSHNIIEVISLKEKIDTTLKYRAFQLLPYNGGPWTIKFAALEETSFTFIFPKRDEGEGARIFQENLDEFVNGTKINDPQPTFGITSNEIETPQVPERAWDWKGRVRLGSGGQGSVYKVKDQKTGEYFAAKSFGQHRHFKKELGYLKALRHISNGRLFNLSKLSRHLYFIFYLIIS
ncbi:hypothetical protein OCU04_008990 [Sclerotinia nivalis]|uniref:Protein kinase domain-containing protein n=1 Tax=Sclerotinia nivalis TaxID=352851 RepID=A0A9X0AHI4_9HELO|nr:hypothetical protein OCU04_008990 [Sclerotinia nivalis]